MAKKIKKLIDLFREKILGRQVVTFPVTDKTLLTMNLITGNRSGNLIPKKYLPFTLPYLIDYKGERYEVTFGEDNKIYSEKI